MELCPLSILPVVAGIFVTPAHAQQDVPTVAAPGAATAGLVCEVVCSSTKPRTGVARISWNESRPPGGAARAEAAAREERLSATVFKGGFEDELYVSFRTEDVEAETLPLSARGGVEPPVPALDVRLTGVERPSVATEAAGVAPTAPQRATAVVEGLEAGVNYYWRITTTAPTGEEVTETVRCQAPVCPADFQEQP
jgi:hypothetical protein